jgi:DNA repair protein RecN (Recombination protein N)
MTGELKDLGMGNTRFEVLFKPNESNKPQMPTPAGDDRIEFMISPNPGEPLKPLVKIASGGELSRLMLAVKTIESGRSGLQTMIFDEIDTGISGRMAQAVAEKMVSIASRRQVICISHLPQIAASADYQYLVYKGVKNDRTYTEVRELTRDQRREEIGRMISGAQGISEDAAAYAGKMMDASEKGKERIRKSSQAPGRS